MDHVDGDDDVLRLSSAVTVTTLELQKDPSLEALAVGSKNTSDSASVFGFDWSFGLIGVRERDDSTNGFVSVSKS